MIFRAFCAVVLCLFVASHAEPVRAADADDQVVSVNPVVRDGKLYVDADVTLQVSHELRNVAEKGVPVYFTADLRIVSERWWWFDKVLVDKKRTSTERQRSEFQSLLRNSYALLCLNKKTTKSS